MTDNTDPQNDNLRNILDKIPSDQEGPVFAEPWQAQAFALAVSLNERGLFSWSEWVEQFSSEISQDGNPEQYYQQWMDALEKLLAAKGIVDEEERHHRKDAWDRASRATPHGEPIRLGRELEAE